MVKIDIVHKFSSWLGLVPSFDNTTASVNPSNSENILKYTGLFGFEELKEPNEFRLFQKNSFKKAEILIENVKNNECKCDLAMVCDELFDTLLRLKSLAYFVMLMLPKKKFGCVAKQIYFDSKQFIDRLYDDREFHYFFKKAAKDKHEILEREPIDTFVINKFLCHSESCHLLSLKKKKVIMKLEREFTMFFGSKWCSRFSEITESPFYSSFCDLLSRRLELAKINGFSSYKEFSLIESIAESPNFVLEFLVKLKNFIKTEVSLDFAETIHGIRFRCPLDAIEFLIEYCEESFFNSESSIKDYFSVETCMDGLKFILRSVYNIDFKVIEDEDIIKGDLWHDDIKKYCIQKGNEILGHIYLDIFARTCKSKGTFLIQPGRMDENGIYQKPVVVVSLSLPSPTNSDHLLLNISDVDLLFFEMGTAMYYILEQKKYRLVCGDQCPRDLFYVPSNLMSYFAYDARVLRKFAKHHQTGDIIPDYLIEKLLDCKKEYFTCKSLMVAFEAIVDQMCHSDCNQNVSPYKMSERFRKIRNILFWSCKQLPLTPCQERRCLYVAHKYRSSYYSHLMSKSLASLIWQKYFKNDPLSLTTGEKFRKEFLQLSGLKPARTVVENYLQMKLTPECLCIAFANQYFRSEECFYPYFKIE